MRGCTLGYVRAKSVRAKSVRGGRMKEWWGHRALFKVDARTLSFPAPFSSNSPDFTVDLDQGIFVFKAMREIVD
uniref:Uncharacterized protein n=1 Tax=Vespula pensylvanica TaxID=30213 RepID=A0A834NWV1_VESPE|nr:hypothetical protein H0235_010297 [Vespula pensylvanica]